MERQTLLGAALALTLGLGWTGPAKGQQPPPDPDVTGTYHGFFQSHDNPDMRGMVTFEITDQDHRRFTGMVTLVVGSPGFVLPFEFDGTVAESNKFTGTGTGRAGKLVFHGMLHFFAGGAAVADASYIYIPESGEHDKGTAIALRGFGTERAGSPPIGAYVGTFMSADGRTGEIRASFTPPPEPETPPPEPDFGANVTIGPYIFPQGRGTINGAGHVVIIGMGTVGRCVLHGQVTCEVAPGPCRVQGNYTIAFFGGISPPPDPDFGTFDITQMPR